MSTAAEKLFTAEEFFAWVELPANRGRRCELRAGEVIEMPPAGKHHGFVCGNVSRILGNFAIARKKGYVDIMQRVAQLPGQRLLCRARTTQLIVAWPS